MNTTSSAADAAEHAASAADGVAHAASAADGVAHAASAADAAAHVPGVAAHVAANVAARAARASSGLHVVVTGPARTLVGGQSRHVAMLEEIARRIGLPMTLVEIGRRAGERAHVSTLRRMAIDYRALWRTLRALRERAEGAEGAEAVERAEPVDVVVHLNSSVQWASLARELGFAMVARVAGASRTVLQIHGSLLTSRDDGRRALRAMTWLLSALCSQVVVLSAHQAAAIGGRVGRRARVIANAIEIAPAPARSSSASMRLLFVGRLVREKGPQLAIQALARLRAQGVAARLTIVGDGDLEATLRRQLAELEIGDAVELMGPVAPSQVRALLAAHDLLLFTPLAPEGLPYVLIEALEAGTPVVATVTSEAVRELVGSADGAIVEASATAQAVAERIAALAASPAALRALGERGRAAASARHSLESSLPRWLDVWRG